MVVSNEQTLEGSHNSLEHFFGFNGGGKEGGKVFEQIGFENTISTITHCKWMKHCMDIITMFMDRISFACNFYYG